MIHNFPGLYLVILNKYRGRATCRMYDFLSSIHLIELRELIGFLLLLTGERHAMWLGMLANVLQGKLTALSAVNERA